VWAPAKAVIGSTRHGRKPIVSTIIITVDTKEHDRLVASTVKPLRQSLGATVAQLASASGIPPPSIEAIERGVAATRVELRDITVALAWLSTNRVARALTL
jgi:DNA-binding XRE family transcriptional regulator